MATPTLGKAFAQTVFKGRNVGPEGMPVTLERITQVLADGQVEVRGVRIPVSGMGAGTLRAGSRVAVAWQQGRPVVAIAHSARRTGAPVPLPPTGAGIIEELFIAGEPVTRDVYFRNDQQVSALGIRALLPGDPVAVRWGGDTRSFVVRVGGPTGTIDFTGTVDNPPQNQTYHVFAFVEAEEGKVLAATEPQAQLVASYSPSLSTLEMLAYNGEYASSLFNRHLKVRRGDTLIDPPPIGLFDPIPQCVPSAFGVIDQADSSLHESGTLGRTAVTLGSILLNQAVGSADTYGPAAIVDFGLDRNRHLLLVIRARKITAALVPVSTIGNVKDANAGTCGWDNLTTPPPTIQPVVTLAGEAHGWVVDLTTPVIKFRTTEVEADLKATQGTSSADVVGIEGLLETIADLDCHPGGSCAATIHTLVSPPTNPNPSVLYPIGAVLPYGTLPAPSITPRQWKDLWDEAQFAFITGSLKRTGTVNNVAKEAAIFTGLAILGYAEPYNPFFVESQLISWSAPTPALPDAPPIYHVQDLRLLQTHMDITYPMLLFISVIRRNNDGTHQYSAYIIKEDRTIVATLRDWTTMGAGVVVSEINAAQTHDGGRAALLSGNFNHLLWEFSTEAERASNTRHIMLTRLNPVTTIEVGTNWSEFADHDFRVLNLDVLYAAKEDDDHKLFIEAWDATTGAPTLSQAAEGYPIEDVELEAVKALADLEPETPAAIARELQAVNDEEALSQTGRELAPEVV